MTQSCFHFNQTAHQDKASQYGTECMLDEIQKFTIKKCVVRKINYQNLPNYKKMQFSRHKEQDCFILEASVYPSTKVA